MTKVAGGPCGVSVAACFQPSCCVPGAASSKDWKLRFTNGSFSTYWELKSIDTSARSVFSCGTSVVTSTVCVTAPTCNCASTVDAASTSTITLGILVTLKPGASIATL